MKRIATLSLLVAFTASGAAFAQSGDMKGMDKNSCMEMKDMKDMDMKTCADMMKGMDMKGMDMKGMDSDSKAQGTSKKSAVHQATAVVKEVDPAKDEVTLAHGPVKSLKWPAMTMGFSVKDKALFDKLAVGKKVVVEFTQQGSGYVVTAVK